MKRSLRSKFHRRRCLKYRRHEHHRCPLLGHQDGQQFFSVIISLERAVHV